MSEAQSGDEVYQHGHHASVVANHAKRTADECAAFMLPLLRPGMRLLDVGCGPGSITSGLARRVAPGKTIGIDMSPSVIETARGLAAQAGIEHLAFEVGNIYEPRFAAASFEVVFVHQVLQHLRRPQNALRRIRTLLAADGMVCAREVDWGGTTFFPDNVGMRRFLELYYALARRNGGEPDAGRHMRRWFREAGFAEARVSTSTTVYADAAATRAWAETYAERTLHSNIAEKALEYGLATRAELQNIAQGWRDWGRDRDAFFCLTHAEVIAKRSAA